MTPGEFSERLLRCARNAPVTVAAETVAQLERYYRLLARWNARINLTALQLTEPTDETFDRLLVEPLAAARFVPRVPLRWLDLGSGGGSPAVPLKIVRPNAALTMVESKARKAAFLREAVRALGLTTASVENARIEDLGASPNARHRASLITIRAVKLDDSIVDAIQQLLAADGRLLLFSPDDYSLTRLESGGFFRLESTKLTHSASVRAAILRRHEQ